MAWETIAMVAPAVLSTLGTVTKAGGQLKGGQAVNQADLYRAQVSRNMAQAYGYAATRAVQGGEVQADMEGMRTAQNVGHAKAAQAASGIDVNTGSAVDVRAGIAQAGRTNQLTRLSDAQLTGWGYRVKAQEAEAQAQLDTAAAYGATQGAALDAAGTIMDKASSLPFNYLKDLGGSSGGNPGAFTGTIADATNVFANLPV